jgi:hypothetical protein|tara:strand:+ start:252 stop:890 length:639 start_codon:yes stop_codon:yes gene_type:complete
MNKLELEIVRKSFKNEKLEDYPYFVETGTHVGDTIFSMERLFKHLHTIELQENLYNFTSKAYNDRDFAVSIGWEQNYDSLEHNKIDFYLGDSAKRIKDVIKKLDDNTMFFLDAHWSGNVIANFGEGLTKTNFVKDKETPLKEEIEYIKNKFKHKAIIIIDDCRLLGGQQYGNWKNITHKSILEILDDRVVENFYLPSKDDDKDRLIIHIKEL